MRVNEQTYAEIMLAVRQNGGTIGPPALVPGLLPVARGGSPSLVASFNTHRGNAKAKQAVDSLRAELDYRRVVAGLPEFRFHAVRRWRFDLAWPWIRVAFELQGGGFTSGRHTRGSGLAKDEVRGQVADPPGVTQGGGVRTDGEHRVGKGVAFMPFHFSGWFQGVDQRSKYPKGNDPIVLGESVNTLTSYGYDPVTGMHEGKVTLCQIQTA